MNGLVSDSLIVLTSLQQILEGQLKSDDNSVYTKSKAGSNDCYDVLCVAMESKFQYISFERGKQVAILDVTVVDQSIIGSGNRNVIGNFAHAIDFMDLNLLIVLLSWFKLSQ